MSRALRPGPLRAFCLVLIVALIWGWHYDRLTPANWSLPLDYSGDALEVLARIKAAEEGDLVLLRPQIVRRLGAPFGADWSEYPASDGLWNHVLGMLARWIGPWPAGSAALLLAHVTAALAFYFCARRLRHRWEWAFAGALLFAFSFFSFWRGLAHLWLVFTGTVPLAIFTCWLVAAGRRTTTRRRWCWPCVGSAAALGASNPYNLFLYFQLLGWSLLAQWLRARWSPGVKLGLVCGAVAAGAFALVYAHSWMYPEAESGLPLLVRPYHGTEVYALKPIELFLVPIQHRSESLARIGGRYLSWSRWRGETFSPYLGLVSVAGLAWLAGITVCRLLFRSHRRVPAHVLPVAWILLFSVMGGLNNLLALTTGLSLFRATNRYSIFLLALVLLFLASELSRLSEGWRPAVRLGLAAVIVAFGLWDQIPRGKTDQQRRLLEERVQTDRAFGAALEARIGSGAMVFQLPILDFPEGQPHLRISEYEHFRPYLATRSLNFSYGAVKTRAIGSWQHDYEQLAPGELARALERHGFAALYINRLGYADRAERLLAELATAGYTARLQDSRSNQVAVLLSPAEHPVPPMARSLTFGRGWHPQLSDEPRWADVTASLSYHNPHSRPLHLSLRLVLSSVGERDLELRLNGRAEVSLKLDEHPDAVLVAALELRPGTNRIDLVTTDRAAPVRHLRGIRRAFALHRLEVRISGASISDDDLPAKPRP
jgi:hypothetical protein